MFMYTAAAHKEGRMYNTMTVSMQTLIGARNCNTNDALILDHLAVIERLGKAWQCKFLHIPRAGSYW